MIKLSIIVPVYNVEPYIRPCFESIFNQELYDDDYEVIIVNDGSTDRSMEMIADIINEHNNILIIDQANQGLSVARNTGMEYAKGDYLLFVDSDDLLVHNGLKELMGILHDDSLDLIIAGFAKLSNDEINKGIKLDNNLFSFETKTGMDIYLNDFDPRQCYVWHTIYKREFLEKNNILFIPDIYFEDVLFTTECYLKANKCLRTTGVFYIYRQRPNSIVSSINMRKLLDMNKVIEKLYLMRKEFVISKVQEQQLLNTIYANFSLAVWFLIHNKSLYSCREEYVKDLKRHVPSLRFAKDVKQTLVAVVFNSVPYFYLRILFLLYNSK